MRKLICSINISADGYCDHGNVVADDELHLYATTLLKQAGAVVLGRGTYSLFESFWPNVKEGSTHSAAIIEFARILNDIRKIVVSKRLDHSDWNNSVVISDLRKLDLLKKESGKDLLIFGSPGLVSSLTKKKMIDEYHILVQPILAGKGKRLFADIVPDETVNLKLTNTTVFKSGVVTSAYSL